MSNTPPKATPLLKKPAPYGVKDNKPEPFYKSVMAQDIITDTTPGSISSASVELRPASEVEKELIAGARARFTENMASNKTEVEAPAPATPTQSTSINLDICKGIETVESEDEEEQPKATVCTFVKGGNLDTSHDTNISILSNIARSMAFKHIDEIMRRGRDEYVKTVTKLASLAKHYSDIYRSFLTATAHTIPPQIFIAAAGLLASFETNMVDHVHPTVVLLLKGYLSKEQNVLLEAAQFRGLTIDNDLLRRILDFPIESDLIFPDVFCQTGVITSDMMRSIIQILNDSEVCKAPTDELTAIEALLTIPSKFRTKFMTEHTTITIEQNIRDAEKELLESTKHIPPTKTVLIGEKPAIKTIEQITPIAQSKDLRESEFFQKKTTTQYKLYEQKDADELKSDKNRQANRKQTDSLYQSLILDPTLESTRTAVLHLKSPQVVEPVSDDDEFIKKYGIDCVVAVGIVDTELFQTDPTQPTNILSQLAPIVNGSYANYAIVNDDETKLRRLGTELNLPDEILPYRHAYCCEDIPVYIRKQYNLKTFWIQQTPRLVLDVDITIPDYLAAGDNLNTRQMTTILQSTVAQTSRPVAEGIASLVSTDRTRSSMLSLFTRAWLIFHQLVALEEFGIQPEVGPLINGDIVQCHVELMGAPAAASIDRWRVAIVNGWPTFQDVEIDAADLECMRTISVGSSGIRTPAQYHWDLITTHIKWHEKANWLILGVTDHMKVIPDAVHPTSAKMRTFIVRMCTLLGRQEDMVNGFIRASILATSKVKIVNTKGVISAYMLNSMLEMFSTSMPQSFADNSVWRLLRNQAPTPQLPSCLIEARMLNSQNQQYYGHLMTLLGLIISLGFSSVFQRFNMTGANLSAYARDQPIARATDLITALTMCNSKDLIPPLCLLASGYIPQISSFSVNAASMVTVSWSGYGLNVAGSAPQHSWRRFFPRSVPYLVQPVALLYTGILLDSNWGYSQPGIKGDFATELQSLENRRTRVWAAHLGEEAYVKYAMTPTPYQYIPYGALVLNCIMQECRRLLAGDLLFVAMKRVDATAYVPIAARPAAWAEFEWDIIPELLMMRAGSLLTYDWREDAIIAPALVLEQQPSNIHSMLELSSQTLFQKAGIRYQGVVTMTTLATNLAEALDFKRTGLKTSIATAKAVEVAKPAAEPTLPKGDKPTTTPTEAKTTTDKPPEVVVKPVVPPTESDKIPPTETKDDKKDKDAPKEVPKAKIAPKVTAKAVDAVAAAPKKITPKI